MKAKTSVLLILAALGGMGLGAWGMQQFGSWEAVFQELGGQRPPASLQHTATRAATEHPADQDDHEEHTHSHEEHAHGEEPQPPATAKTPPPPKAGNPRQQKDTHTHDADVHEHGKETPRPTTAKEGRSGKSAPPKRQKDPHGHSGDEHGHGAEKVVRLSAAKAQQLGIEVAVARAGSLQTRLTLPGTVTLNFDRRVHVVSRIPGIVQEVRKNLGDPVRAGEVMAVIDSRELADAKALYLAARERLSLAESTFAREKDLWEKKIAPEQDYLTAQQALAEVRIEIQVAAQKLRALGFTEVAVHQLSFRATTPLTRYEVVAPLVGTVIEKHMTIGEVLKDDTEAFIVADLSTVWVDLNVPANDLRLVRKGQRVVVEAGPAMQAEGTVGYISPVVAEETRTAVTRVVLPNSDGRWRPGLFVTATIAVGDTPVSLLIPKSALQTVDGRPSVFVQTPEGFAPRPVTLGRANETQVEITAGLQAGERYAATETFVLKADLGKGTASHDH